MNFVFLQMFTLPQKDFSAPTTCLGPTCMQDLGSSHGDDLEGECSRKLDQKLPELPGVGDSAMFSPDTSYLSSRGRMIKWFWDSAEEGYRTYHMDEYDENKNPSVSEAPLPLAPERELQGGIPYLDQ